MRCPHCGEEISPGKTCSRCGKTLPPQKEVEVEYKEFRISEMLDIKMPKSGGARRAARKAEPSPRRTAGTGNALRKDDSGGRKTSAVIITTIILIILAAIAGIYLYKYLPGF